MSKNNGGFVYPLISSDPNHAHNDVVVQEGITRRDWLAGLAMQGLVAAIQTREDPKIDYVTTKAYQIADAMIAESERK
jgi:hypothetical protein